ncbi:clathrin light chain B isoform X1 [Tachysurus fulvidraco]|uniref:clathrin light chain B isoform X1 n=1 Tax=Tachysurus fulvidraco TaxID=1234273 RepID=UPI000F50B815|nr:clathrin light chain B isoform X1 [Tachysurus fulvidraco]
MADAFGLQTEEDPAAAFLAQQQHEIAGIENDEDNFGFEFTAHDQPEAGAADTQPSHFSSHSFEDEFRGATMNGELFQDTNDVTDGYAAISQVDVQRQEPESLRKWREEQKGRLEELDSASKAAEIEWKEKAKKELEDWHAHQREQMEKNKVNNRKNFLLEASDFHVTEYQLDSLFRIADKAFYKQPNSDVIGFVASEDAFLKECDDNSPGTEWEKVARLCDFNPKTSRQTKDVSRMRSVLISLKQTPLSR